MSVSDVFEERVGCIKNYEIFLKLCKDSTPVYIKERQIPCALTQRVDKELDSL